MRSYVIEWLPVVEERQLLKLLRRNEFPLVKIKGKPSLVLTTQRLLIISGLKNKVFSINNLNNIAFKDNVLFCTLKITLSDATSHKKTQSFYFNKHKKPHVYAATQIINQILITLVTNVG